MIIKERNISVSHLILESLNDRKRLYASEKAQYDNCVKGFAGEREFDQQIKQAGFGGLVVNDLLLKIRDTHYQIDSLLITDDRIYLYEIKNYCGEYHYTDGTMYTKSGYALQSPVAQAERKCAYLHNLLVSLGCQRDISVHIVFINPDFYIYNLPKTPEIIFAGQLSRHLKSVAVGATKQAKATVELAKRLTNMHYMALRPTTLLDYCYDDLRKGIFCPKCFSFSSTYSRQNRYCSGCGHREKSSKAASRCMEELILLFPEKPLTKRFVHDWCLGWLTPAQIKSVLKEKYRLHHTGRSTSL